MRIRSRGRSPMDRSEASKPQKGPRTLIFPTHDRATNLAAESIRKARETKFVQIFGAALLARRRLQKSHRRILGGKFQLTDSIASATEIRQAHFRIFAGQQNAGSASTKRGTNGVLDALRGALTVAFFRGDINVNAGPYERIPAFHSFERTLCFTKNVV